jgi:predicted ATPase
MNNNSTKFRMVRSLRIEGYRPFRDFKAELAPLNVIVGANGTGKSSLFEFIRFLSDAVQMAIPPEIVVGSIGRQIFHRPGPDRLGWEITADVLKGTALLYQAVLLGPVGRIHIPNERVSVAEVTDGSTVGEDFLNVTEGKGFALADAADVGRQSLEIVRPNELGLTTIGNYKFETLYRLREFISEWRCYGAFSMDMERVRRSVPIEQEPILNENCSNLSAVLFYLSSEHPQTFSELKFWLRLAIPGFRDLSVKARGGPGEVIAFWQEEGSDTELTLADLSDGSLHFLAWSALCLVPNPPSLLCIDEPDQGIHPRALPILAGMLQKASSRTQVLVATHSSFFLSQFDIESVAVMKKVNGESIYVNPSGSKALLANLEEFGASELEIMHRSDELEALT